MGDKDKSKISSSEMENLSLDSSGYSRDLLTRFMGSSSGGGGWREGEFGAKKEEGCKYDDVDDEGEEEEIELNLGLSLGGRLGVDKGSMKLIRSSSIAECLPLVKDKDDSLTHSPPAVAYSRLVRTTSLPLGSDEELRKRKELQTIRRMEAKKRRSEKQRNLKGEREEASGGGAQLLGKDKVLEPSKPINSWAPPPFGSPSLTAAGREKVLQREIRIGIAKGKGMQEFEHIIPQGALESREGSSFELDNKSLQRRDSCGNTSPGNIQLLQESSKQDMGGSSGTKTRENLGRTSSLEVEKTRKESDMARSNQAGETRANTLEDMPSVFTRGDGPNGRRVDGILYKYGRGEEVRIMCVCHGRFHSPVEFVKHAGGTDITHPLKHIVINPNPTPFN